MILLLLFVFFYLFISKRIKSLFDIFVAHCHGCRDSIILFIPCIAHYLPHGWIFRVWKKPPLYSFAPFPCWQTPERLHPGRQILCASCFNQLPFSCRVKLPSFPGSPIWFSQRERLISLAWFVSGLSPSHCISASFGNNMDHRRATEDMFKGQDCR